MHALFIARLNEAVFNLQKEFQYLIIQLIDPGKPFILTMAINSFYEKNSREIMLNAHTIMESGFCNGLVDIDRKNNWDFLNEYSRSTIVNKLAGRAHGAKGRSTARIGYATSAG
jgi:hypothetical protein